MAGAGAGIGGNGGSGGDGNHVWTNGKDNYLNNGGSGGQGENAGSISIYDSIIVYAYGGAGNGTLTDSSGNSGAGGSGYPAAGIGRRWCWRPEEDVHAMVEVDLLVAMGSHLALLMIMDMVE